MASNGRSTPSGPSRRESIQTPVPNTTSVKVVLRIRPPTETSNSNVPQRFQRTVIHPVNAMTLQVEQAAVAHAGATAASAANLLKNAGKTTFTFDRVIGPQEGQPAVYDCAEPLVDSFLEGMNSTILAYGQTSSGKSYTMGTDRTSDADDDLGEERLGITPRAVASIFERIRAIQKETNGRTTFQAKLSYLEIYEEALIDLLAGDVDVRPTVQIREDKEGNIIWSGLREVKVSNALEVMELLTAGSSLRQTSATGMNSQSSRSHAIFSLTLVQRKYTGTGAPPTPSTTTPSRFTNRMSALPRVSSPTPGGRAGTPTSDRPSSRFGLRPPSSMGGTRSSSPLPGDESPNEKASGADSWVTITSKFHFVDLAGSERLKRTAAQGERVKEGISINSGLHALGNVISALGDPARARQTTHIPYRDSKLTRLLQDSLGGNAQTMMIACVSPTEFNLNETLSTLKYANRARNIKNRAEINEIEVGWDDVEYLQRTILRLRAELAAIRSGDAAAMGSIAEEGRRTLESGSESSRELQDKYSELTQRYAQLTAELAKAQSGISTSSLTREDFAKAVEPIVEEYERSLSALESQLSLTKAALAHAEEEMRELDEKLREETKSNEARAVLIGELKSRVAKLAERESTTEAYVRDLEARLKDGDHEGENRGSAISDLRKELARSREQSETTEAYVRELEDKLTKSDEANTHLHKQIEALERDVKRREDAYRDLEGRLSALDTSGEHKLLLAELDDRDRRLLDLERSYDELKIKTQEAEQEAERLEHVAQRESEEKEELRSKIRTLESKERGAVFTPPTTPHVGDTLTVSSASSPSTDPVATAALAAQLAQLQASYDVTLGELEAANARYQASLKEIHDLHSQVEHSRLLRSDPSNFVTPTPSPNRGNVALPASKLDDDETEVLLPTVPASPQSTDGRPQLRTRRSMPLAPQARLSFLGRAGGGPSPTFPHGRSASLSQELSAVQGLQSFSIASPGLLPGRRDSRSDWSPGATDRSYDQLKEEIMKLQLALREREEEISVLENNLHHIRRNSVATPNGYVFPGPDGRSHLVASNATSPSPDHGAQSADLSPNTLAAFDAFKADLLASTLAGATLSVEDSVRLDDLMRVMAKKESSHRDSIEQLEEQLATLRRQHEDLTALSRDQVVNMSSEIEGLRAQLDGRPDSGFYESQLDVMRRELDAKSAELDTIRTQAEADLSSALAKLTREHQLVVESNAQERDALILQLKEEHSDLLRRTLAERDEVLRQKESEYAAAIKSQAAEHATALQLRSADHEAALQAKSDKLEALRKRRVEEHAESTRRFELERSALIDSEKGSFATTLEQLNADHAAVLEKREAEFLTASEKIQNDHALALSSRDASHSSTINTMRAEHDASVGELITSHSESLARLRDEHEANVRSVADKHSLALSTLKAQHESALAEAATSFETREKEVAVSHGEVLENLKAQHQAQVESIKVDHSTTMEDRIRQQQSEFEARLATVVAAHATTLSELSAEHEETQTTLVEDHSTRVAALLEEHDSAVKGIKDSHGEELHRQQAVHEQAVQDLVETHTLATTSMRDTLQKEHEAALSDLAAQHATALDGLSQAHDQKLASLESDHRKALTEHEAHHQLELEGVDEQLQQMATELDDVRKSHQQLLSAYTALYSEHAALNNSLGTTKAEHDELLERFTSLSKRHDAIASEHQLELSALQTSLQEASTRQNGSSKDPDHQATALELQEALDALSTLEKALLESQQEREGLLDRIDQLTLGHDEKKRFDSTLKELESYRASVTKLDAELARTRAERDDLSTKLARMSGSGHGHTDMNGSQSNLSDSDPRSVTPDRNGRVTPPTRQDSRSGVNGTSRLPPPTPPPSMPLPSQPVAMSRTARSSSSSSLTNSRNSNSVDSTTTTGTSLRSPGSADSAVIDPRVAKRFEEQEAQIAKLTKQLSHTESDLQANVDLVNTLESALNDSERNLRKARTQMNDIARERDTFANQNEDLRKQVVQAESETEAVRNSVLQVETRLQEERQGKERAKAELQSRLEDVNRRKSKYACF